MIMKNKQKSILSYLILSFLSFTLFFFLFSSFLTRHTRVLHKFCGSGTKNKIPPALFPPSEPCSENTRERTRAYKIINTSTVATPRSDKSNRTVQQLGVADGTFSMFAMASRQPNVSMGTLRHRPLANVRDCHWDP